MLRGKAEVVYCSMNFFEWLAKVRATAKKCIELRGANTRMNKSNTELFLFISCCKINICFEPLIRLQT